MKIVFFFLLFRCQNFHNKNWQISTIFAVLLFVRISKVGIMTPNHFCTLSYFDVIHGSFRCDDYVHRRHRSAVRLCKARKVCVDVFFSHIAVDGFYINFLIFCGFWCRLNSCRFSRHHLNDSQPHKNCKSNRHIHLDCCVKFIVQAGKNKKTNTTIFKKQIFFFGNETSTCLQLLKFCTYLKYLLQRGVQIYYN